ncbi:MAG: HAD family hydrolase [Fimbriimonadaceae bacterium]
MPEEIRAVCFDLGGVLARICHTWRDALQTAGLTQAAERFDPKCKLVDYELFEPYQAGEVDLNRYARELGEFLGVSPQEAVHVHNRIIIEPYPGTESVITSLQRANVATACMSNTNTLHWDVFMQGVRFPGIASLEVQVASHLVGVNKPEEGIYREVKRLVGSEGSAILYMDDSPEHVEGAKRLGWQAYRIDPHVETTADQINEILSEQGVRH